MPKNQQQSGSQKISSMLALAPRPIQEKVNKRRQRKEEEGFRKLQVERAEQAQKGEFAPPQTP